MPLSFDAAMLKQLEAAQAAYLALLTDDGVIEKEAFGQKWKKSSNLDLLYEQIVKLEKRCEQRGILPMRLGSSKKAVTQLQVFNPGQIFR